MARQMFRYEVPVDDREHEHKLAGDPVAVAAVPGAPGAPGEPVVEFWAEHDASAAGTLRSFRAFATGEALPGAARWAGTCGRLHGEVWHLYEVTPDETTESETGP